MLPDGGVDAGALNTESEQPTDALLKVRDLRVTFSSERGPLEVVHGISFDVGRGETVGLVGESGSGKTVTGLSIMQLIPDPPGRITGGSIEFEGTDLATLSRHQMRKVRGARIGMVFQEPMTSLSPAFTVGEQIAETVRCHMDLSRRDSWKRAVEMLGLVGIPHPAHRAKSYPHEFSGGMRQRVMMAIALCCRPQLLIADEPTTALDVTIQAQILDLIADLRDQMEMSVVFITHDLGVVAEVCDRVVVMYSGDVVEAADALPLYTKPLHPYTEGLLASLPLLDRGEELISIPGSAPLPWDVPTGCSFHPRCKYCEPGCIENVPPLEVVDDRAVRCLRWDKLHLAGTE